MARDTGIQVAGLAKLNRDLGRISNDFRKDSLRHLREIGNRVRDTARPDAPRRSGRLARSLRVSSTNRGTAVTSRLPYAGVIEYGGEISPRGVPITIEPAEFIGAAIVEHADDIDEQLGDLLDRVARGNGFRLP